MKRRVMHPCAPPVVLKKLKKVKNSDEIPRPKRSQFTKKQWCEYGDLIRAIKVNAPGIVGSEVLSLNDLRDVYQSVQVCTSFRVLFQAKKDYGIQE